MFLYAAVFFVAVLGGIALLVRLWQEDVLSLLELILALMLFLAAGKATLLFWETNWRWALLLFFFGSAAVAIYLASGGEERLFMIALRREAGKLERRARANPTDPVALVELGEVYQRLRRHQQALHSYRQAEELMPTEREYQQKVKQMKHIIEAIGANVRACPACNAPIGGRPVVCPTCGETIDEYLYAAERFGREPYLLVSGAALGTLLLVFVLGLQVGWKPGWLVAALLSSGFIFVTLALLRRSRKAAGG